MASGPVSGRSSYTGGNLSNPVAVDFFTNCFERDYRTVLGNGFMPAKAAQLGFRFRHRVVTINNVADKAEAQRWAREALRRGDIDRFVFVEDHLPEALHTCGLRKRDLGRVAHFVDWALVLVTCTDAPYVMHLDADATLDRTLDWITPALARMEADDRFLVANPAWSIVPDGAWSDAMEVDGYYCIGYGFSDACFVARREELAQPVYHYQHPDSERYPLSAVGDVFEKRVDAYMRVNGRLRLTDTRVFFGVPDATGTHYPKRPFLTRATGRIAREARKLTDRLVRRDPG